MIRKLADFPTPVNGEITLDASKTYTVSGTVNIGANYINLNGAVIRGMNPLTDVIVSAANGAVLRSVNNYVFIEKLAIVPATASTTAYDFSDATGTKSCNLITGNTVKDPAGVTSGGMGQVSGFRLVGFVNNVFMTAEGLKVTGNMGRFVFAFNSVEEIKSGGTGLEFLPGNNVKHIDITNNYFVNTVKSNQEAIKADTAISASFEAGRISSNMFNGVRYLLRGVSPYTPGWEMNQNLGIPNSRSYAHSFYSANTIATSSLVNGVYKKIEGATINTELLKFTSNENNKFTYAGKRPIVGKILAVVGGKSPANNSNFTVAVAKNGTIVSGKTYSSTGDLAVNQRFQVVLETQLDLKNGDTIEIFIKTNNPSVASVTINDLQFRVQD